MILLITFLLTYGALWLQKRSGDHCAVEEGVHEDGLKKASRIFHRRSRVLSQGRIATANARRWHIHCKDARRKDNRNPRPLSEVPPIAV